MSSKARLATTAAFVEKQPVAQVVRDYGVSRSWVYELLVRYRAEGAAAFEPRSRRPRTSPRATAPKTVEPVLALRKRLAEQGLDAGPDTIGWHLAHHHPRLSRATILNRTGCSGGSGVPRIRGVLIAAAAIGLGATVVSAVSDDDLETMFGLDHRAEPVLGVAVVGVPAESVPRPSHAP